MKKILLSIFFLFCGFGAGLFANNVQIDSVSYNKATGRVSFLVSWENAWRQTLEFHDAVWVFCKYRTLNTARWQHARVKTGSSQAGGILETKEVSDRLGFFVRFKSDSLGHVLPTKVSFEPTGIVGLFPDFKVIGIEMVYVPQGQFYAGTSGEDSLGFAKYKYFYQRSIGLGNGNFPMIVASESEMESDIGRQIYNTGGTIPAEFPKGYAAFYCMKHELTFGLVKEFGNSVLSSAEIATYLARDRWSVLHTFLGGNTGEGNQITGWTPMTPTLNRPDKNGECWVPWGMTSDWFFSILYWAGLAPMTELQYEKACRGPMYPVRNEHASGQPSNYMVFETSAFRFPDSLNSRLVLRSSTPVINSHLKDGRGWRSYRAGVSANDSTNRLTSNASYYGILNLSDGVGETVIACDTGSYRIKFDGKSQELDQLQKFTFRCQIRADLRQIETIPFTEGTREFTQARYGKGYAPRPIPQTFNETTIAMGRGVRKPD